MDLSPETQREMLRTMQTIRRFEERASADYHAGNIYGVVHCYLGEEAVAVGVCAALNPDDQIISTHRGHGHCIAKGADLDRMMAELYGRETGYCKGKGGSMHIADFEKGMLGANGIVAGGISIVTGAALAAQLLGNGRIAVSFFGDGASNAGPFHESINIAAAWKLPIIYVCENNGYAAQTPQLATHAAPDIAGRAAGYGIPGVIVDGNDVFAVYRSGRQGCGPRTRRRRAHADRVQDLPPPCRTPNARASRTTGRRRKSSSGCRTRATRSHGSSSTSSASRDSLPTTSGKRWTARYSRASKRPSPSPRPARFRSRKPRPRMYLP